MSDHKDNLEHIRQYIQKHERYFEALGFQRPGGLPRYYTEQRPEEWPLDLAKVERLKREEQARDRAAAHSDRTASSGMSKEARDLLDSIRSLADQGLTPEQIAAQLRLVEDGVRNVLAMGQPRLRPGCGSAGAHPGDQGVSQRVRAALLVKREVRLWKTRRTGTSTRSHPRWSWAWPITGARPSLSGAMGTTPKRLRWCG